MPDIGSYDSRSLTLATDRFRSEGIVPAGGLEALVREPGSTLDDTERMREILKEELDYMSGKGLLLAIAQQYRLAEGDHVAVDPKWRTVKNDGKFPLSGVQGKVNEVQFRAMVRCMVLGLAEDIQLRQPNGRWCLKDYRIVKTHDGDTQVMDVQGSRLVAVPGAGGAAIPQSQSVMIADGATPGYQGEGVPETLFKQRVVQRSVFLLDLTYVDIKGEDAIEYRNGRPVDEITREAQKDRASMSELVAALAGFARGGVAAPSVTPSPSADDALEILARSYGVKVVDLKKNLSAALAVSSLPPIPNAPAEPTERFPVPVPTAPLDVVVPGADESWACPLCEHTSSSLPIAVEQHMKGHERKREVDRVTRQDYVRRYREAYATHDGE